jgi:hypothetical protein
LEFKLKSGNGNGTKMKITELNQKYMTKKTKLIIFRYLISFIIFLIVWAILHFTFENLGNPYKGMISAGIMAILSPRIKEYETQSGKQMQLKWIFLRKPISI